MKEKDHERQMPVERRPYARVLISGVVVIAAFSLMFGYQIRHYVQRIEKQRRVSLVQLVMVARNAIEPLVAGVRNGLLPRSTAMTRIRDMVRKMVYDDQYGKNYIFMSAYDGTMLVQPFEPHKEMTDQWDLRDEKGTYIIRELVKSARGASGSGFVSYYYYIPGIKAPQEKLAYVVGIPELQCYIGTGMYMHDAYMEQRSILRRAVFWSAVFVALLVLSVLISLREISRRNRTLVREVDERKRAQDELMLFRDLVDYSNDAVFLIEPYTGKILEASRRGWEGLGYGRDEIPTLTVGDIDVFVRDMENTDAVYDEIRRTGSRIVESVVKRRDGGTFPVETSIRYVTHGNKDYIVAVARDITERKRADQKIKESLHEKELLLKEIHHRVKNNFQMTTSLLSLKLMNTENPEAREGLLDSRNRIYSMAMIHEKLYRSDDLSHLNFDAYLMDIIYELHAGYSGPARGINLSMDMDEVRLGIDRAIPAGLVVNELVTNALKYAFPEGWKADDRTIRVSLKKEEDHTLMIAVSDNGVGMPEGYNPQKATTLGLALVPLLVDQLQGVLDINRGKGTTVTVRFGYGTEDSPPAKV